MTLIKQFTTLYRCVNLYDEPPSVIVRDGTMTIEFSAESLEEATAKFHAKIKEHEDDDGPLFIPLAPIHTAQ